MSNPFRHLGPEVSKQLADHIQKLLQDASVQYEAGQITAGHYVHLVWKLVQINGELAQTLPHSATVEDLEREVAAIMKRREERKTPPD